MIQRTEDPNVIEHRLLELAYTTDHPITASVLAYFTPCSVEDAEKVLDNLVARDRIEMEIGDDGAITYVFPNRHKLSARHEPAPAHHRALVPRGMWPLAIRQGRHASPALAAVLSLIVPGAGQLYTGNVATAVLWFVLVTLGYTLVLPGLFLHLFCIATAASSGWKSTRNHGLST